jgi:hypothetical protein
MIPRPIPVMLLTPLLITTSARAGGDPIPVCDPPKLIGLLDDFRDPNAITIDGDYAYIIDDFDRFSIIDISDPTNPRRLSRIDAYTDAFSIAINGDAAYLINNNQIGIFNIEDKADPWFRRWFSLNGSEALPRSDSHIFLSEYALNIERPLAPAVDPYTTPFPFIEEPTIVLGDELFTSDLSRYNISNPLGPTLTFDNLFSLPFFEPEYTRYESPIFISSGEGRDLVFATNIPTEQFIAISMIDNPPYYDATIRSGLIYALNANDDTLTVIAPDSAGLNTIATFGEDDGISRPRFIRQLGDYFLILSENQLGIYEIPTNPIASTPTIAPPTFLERVSDTIIAGTERINPGPGTINLIDTSSPSTQRNMGLLPAPTQSRLNNGMASIATNLFVADDQFGLNQYDLSDPANPLQIATYDTGIVQSQRTRDIDILDNLALVADSRNGIISYVINADLSLTQAGHLPSSDPLQRVTILGDLAFACSNFHAYLIDISDPTQMSIISTLEPHGGEPPNYLTAQRVGDLLYTAEYDNGYRIIDITDPADPVEIAQFDADITTPDGTYQAFAYDILVEDNLLYIALSSGGFAIFENSNIFAPVLLTHIAPGLPQSTTQVRFREFIKDGNNLYIAAGEAGLRTYSLDGCSLPCSVDFNNDGSLNFFDVTIFIEAFINTEPSADLNNDGVFNFFDVFEFIAAYQAGCP